MARRQLSYELVSISVQHKRNNKEGPTILHFKGFTVIVGNRLLVVEVNIVDEVDEVEDWLVVPRDDELEAALDEEEELEELDVDELEVVPSEEEELDVEESKLDDELLVAELLVELELVELLDDEALDEDELLDVDVILDDVELLVIVEDVLEDVQEVELVESGTPPGPRHDLQNIFCHRVEHRRRKGNLVVVEVVNNVHGSENSVSDNITIRATLLNSKKADIVVGIRENGELAQWNLDCDAIEAEIDCLCTRRYGARDVS
jgi:hypothetical protein